MKEIKFKAIIVPVDPREEVKIIDILYAAPLMRKPERVFDLERQKYKDDMYDITLIQSTGKTDIDGREVFEGDVVEFSDEDLPTLCGQRGVVIFREFPVTTPRFIIKSFNHEGSVLTPKFNDVRVVGNDYLNENV